VKKERGTDADYCTRALEAIEQTRAKRGKHPRKARAEDLVWGRGDK